MSIKKEILKDLILDASQMEEDIIPTLTRFLHYRYDWRFVDKLKVREIKKLLNEIERDSMNHNMMLNKLLKSMERWGKDAY
jgi:hypothetical protein